MATTPLNNPTIELMLKRRSVRKYTSQMPDDDVIHTIVRAGMQAPFSGQLYSVLLDRKKRHPFGAPLYFILCADLHRMELIMARRGWKTVTNDISILLFALQDAAYMGENMVMAAESLGLGSCFIGSIPNQAKDIQAQFSLPPRVFPLVGLVMGYPDEEIPPRPRYPLDFVLFEDRYPELTEDQITAAMKSMDEGYLAQGYYLNLQAKIDLEDPAKKETFDYDRYSWTEHISRKWGQWLADPAYISDMLKNCGFSIQSEEG